LGMYIAVTSIHLAGFQQAEVKAARPAAQRGHAPLAEHSEALIE